MEKETIKKPEDKKSINSNNHKAIVVVENFRRKFKNMVIGPLSFKIYEGTITALLGSSGSGKTVVLNSVVGATRSFKGKVLVNGYSRKSASSHLANQSLGFYTQMDFSLYEVKAYNFLKNICLTFGMHPSIIPERIEKWMKIFEIWDSRNKKIKEYSWGMKNRVNLLIAFIKEPNLLLLDEPGANLDSIWREKIKKIIYNFNSSGKTVIITVHNIDEIADIINDFIVIDKGKMVFNGSKLELNLYKKYKIELFAAFDYEYIKEMLEKYGIKTFKYKPEEHSFVVAIDTGKQINILFLLFVKQGLPIKTFMKLPINMESIYKALEK